MRRGSLILAAAVVAFLALGQSAAAQTTDEPKLYRDGRSLPRYRQKPATAATGLVLPHVQQAPAQDDSPVINPNIIPAFIPEGATVVFHRDRCPAGWAAAPGFQVEFGYLYCEKK